MRTRWMILGTLVIAAGTLAALWGSTRLSAEPPKPDAAALIKRGDYLVNQVARCGDCHTPRNAKGEPDLARNLQGAKIWFAPKVKPKEWEDEAPDITAGGVAGKWKEAELIKLLTTGRNPEG